MGSQVWEVGDWYTSADGFRMQVTHVWLDGEAQAMRFDPAGRGRWTVVRLPAWDSSGFVRDGMIG